MAMFVFVYTLHKHANIPKYVRCEHDTNTCKHLSADTLIPISKLKLNEPKMEDEENECRKKRVVMQKTAIER